VAQPSRFPPPPWHTAAMRKRVQIALAVLLVAIVGMVVWQVLREREPVYQGKRLTVWLDQYHTQNWAGHNRDSGRQAEDAIRHFGTNAIPIYLKLMSTRDSPLKHELMSRAPWWLLSMLHMREGEYYRWLGAWGISCLGEDAKPAIPALIALLNVNDPSVQYQALVTLCSLGPAASDAVPSLIKCLHSPDVEVQRWALRALGKIHAEPERVIPILVEVLAKPQNPQYVVMLRTEALRAVRQFGAQAKPAVPRLVELLNGDARIRSDTTNALMAIDREVAAQVGVK